TNQSRREDHVFISFAHASKGSPVTKGTILLVPTIQDCHKTGGVSLAEVPRAHSTRIKGVMLATLGNVSLNDLYMAATWSSVHSFTKHYCMDNQANKESQV
ncbi:hypothetical protein NDU88_002479, partial [Pleurodeles waltl]